MAYIGKTPTPVPLTSSDITDGIISIADLATTGTASSSTFLRGDGAFAEAGGGKLLQSVLVTTSTNQAISSATYADLTGMTANITPTKTSSTLLVQAYMNIALTVGAGADEGFYSQILRDSTVINNSATSSGYGSLYYYTGDASNLHLVDVNIASDSSHNTTSQVTIKVQGKVPESADSIQFNFNSLKKSYLLIQEIG